MMAYNKIHNNSITASMMVKEHMKTATPVEHYRGIAIYEYCGVHYFGWDESLGNPWGVHWNQIGNIADDIYYSLYRTRKQIDSAWAIKERVDVECAKNDFIF